MIYIKLLSIPFLYFICLSQNNLYAHRKFDIKSNNTNESKINLKNNYYKENRLTLEEEFDSNFDGNQTFEESIDPSSQLFKTIFGLGGFPETNLKKSAFSLWETYEKEMSGQIGKKRLKGSDIDNTYNGSLKTLTE